MTLKTEAEQELEREMQALDAALAAFAAEMRRRLEQKARRGFRGWNHPAYLSSIKTRALLRASEVAQNSGDHDAEADLANLAMMAWWQRTQRQSRG